MYKITPPSQQTYKGPKILQNQVSQISNNNETVTEEILQSSSEQYREQLEQMLDLKPNNQQKQNNNNNSNSNSNNIELWSTIQSIQKRIEEQEENLQKVNNEQQQEINKLKNELKQQKQLYESEIEEIKYSSRISSQKPQNYIQQYSPYSSKTNNNNNKEQYNYRNSFNNAEETSEKLYLQQLVQDLRQQIQQLQQKNYYTPIQNDNVWEQRYKQLEKQKETELQIKDQHHVERICHLETQMLNQKQSYENELYALRKILDEKSKDDSILRSQNQQLQKDLNSYVNQFNLLSQQVQQQNQQIQQYQQQLQQLQQQPVQNQANNQQLLELANQLQALTSILEKKNQECEYYKQRMMQNQQQIQPNQQIITYRQALTPTRQNIMQANSDSIVFPTLTKQSILQQYQ